jgi:hypothetical protein
VATPTTAHVEHALGRTQAEAVEVDGQHGAEWEDATSRATAAG